MRAEAGPERGRPLVVRSTGAATSPPIAKRAPRTAGGRRTPVRLTALPAACDPSLRPRSYRRPQPWKAGGQARTAPSAQAA